MTKTFIKIGFSIFLLWFLIEHIELNEFFNELFNLSPLTIIGALFCMILQTFIVSGRWRIIIEKISKTLPFSDVIRIHYLSLGSSLFLSQLVAEPAFKSLLMKKFDIPVSKTLLSIIMDKVFVLLGLILMTLAVAPSIGVLYSSARVWASVYILVIGLFLGVYFLYGLLKSAEIGEYIRKILDKYPKILQIGGYILFDQKLILRCLSLTLVSQVLGISAVYILSLHMDLGLTYNHCILLMPPVMLATSIPITFNGWGVREIAMIYMLGLVNIPSETALALSIQFGIIGMLLWSIGLIVWFLHINKNE